MNTVFTNRKLRNNYLWNDIELQVPKELITVSKKGKVSMKNPMTKKNNISKFEKKPSIIIDYSKDNRFHLISDTIADKAGKLKKDIKGEIVKRSKNKNKIIKKTLYNYGYTKEPIFK